jgi:3-hydroxyacyl-CoA dehydrogenase/enoyl-CoA hydratase/3-hydroxybutyryl-CoA epimerase
MSLPVTYSVDSDGIGWIDFNDPASRANVLNPALLAALRVGLDGLARQPVKAVVVLSAKENIFIAGADLKWLGQLPDAAAAVQVSREGQALFSMLADFKVPVLCAVDGACAGGGYELALACHWRIASDAQVTLIGLPEVSHGLIPAWGGCVRLPRLIGALAATKHILRAKLLPAAEALRAGLVDEVVPAASLKARAKVVALRLAAAGKPARSGSSASLSPMGTASPLPEQDVFLAYREKALARGPARQAQLAALEVIEQGAALPLAEALELEAARFGAVAAGEVAKNLIRVFFLKNAAKKTNLDAWFPPEPAGAPALAPLRNIGIIGAGVMGTGIAQWCAMRGLGVLLYDVDRAILKQSVEIIRELFREAENHGKLSHAAAHKAMGGIGLSSNLEDYEFCDLVIETVTENAAVKQQLLTELARFVPPGVVLATNTSALSIEKITAGLPEPGRIVGLHFFNPVNRMALVEIALTAQTSRATAARALEFVQALGKTPSLCRSNPGLLVTRVLAGYLNEACQLREQGVQTEVIDQAMTDWGWPMGPLRLIDEVGVEVVNSIFDELQQFYPGRFVATHLCSSMVNAGMGGRKNGASSGFYSYNGERELVNPLVDQFTPAVSGATEAGVIQDKLVGRMIAETKLALGEGIVKSADEADLALLLGIGFPAFRGGLMHYAKTEAGSGLSK